MIVKRLVFRAQAPENIAKQMVSFRRWMKNHAFCNVFWRLGAEKHAFHDGLARLGARAARIQVRRSPPAGCSGCWRGRPGGDIYIVIRAARAPSQAKPS